MSSVAFPLPVRPVKMMMISVRQRIVYAVVGVWLLAARVSATPLTSVETTDFSNTSPGSVIGTLDVGVNTASGSVNGATDLADYTRVDGRD